MSDDDGGGGVAGVVGVARGGHDGVGDGVVRGGGVVRVRVRVGIPARVVRVARDNVAAVRDDVAAGRVGVAAGRVAAARVVRVAVAAGGWAFAADVRVWAWHVADADP